MKFIEYKNYYEVDGLKCHWNFWLLPKRFIAITLFGHIFFNISKEEVYKYLITKKGKITLNHERIHTIQAKSFKAKYLGFYIYYLYYWIKNLFKYGVKDIVAYKNIPFELEAYDKEYDFDYNETNWRKYCDK